MIRLSALIEGAGVMPEAIAGDSDIAAITADSRKVTAGALFVLMPSANVDTASYLPEAMRLGATAIITQSRSSFDRAATSGIAAVLIGGDSARFYDSLWRIAKLFLHNPTGNMKVIGVTGTNGKTTTAWILRSMLTALRAPSGYLGTLGFTLPSGHRELPNTTPFAVELLTMLAEARDEGVRALAMEVSSHALAEHRADGVEFDAAIFTNLSQDHLDFHGSMDQYEAAKYRLFSDLRGNSTKHFVAAINVDDPVGRRWAGTIEGDQITFGKAFADLTAGADHIGLESMRLNFNFAGMQEQVNVPLGGSFNFYNCLSATAGMLALGYSFHDVMSSLQHVHPVPGRFEPVKNDKGVSVIVDYAHTPDALTKLLESVRELNPARIITVFGCGGDRDRSKRPLMAAAASNGSDVVVLTSDNPRSEDRNAILADVEVGLTSNSENIVLPDRKEAIARAVELARPGDAVVIAGKGHETYQIVGRTKYPMDDRETVREAMSRCSH